MDGIYEKQQEALEQFSKVFKLSFSPGSTVAEIAIPAFCVTIGLTSFALISALTISYIIAYFLGILACDCLNRP